MIKESRLSEMYVNVRAGIFRALLAILATLMSFSVTAQDALVGIWQGTLEVSPEISLVVQFSFSENEKGETVAFLNAPAESTLTNVPVNELSFENSNVILSVAKVNGRYEGVVAENEIIGEWKQQGQSFPLKLLPYEPKVMSEAEKDRLRGPWFGELKMPKQPDPIALGIRFETNSDGEFVAFLDSPDQGVRDIYIDEFSLEDGVLKATVLEPRMVYIATLDGNKLDGEFTQRNTMALTLNKGEYQFPKLNVSDEDIEKLLGQWNGVLENSLAIILRVEEVEDGGYIGVLDSPDQGRFNFPVEDLTFSDDKFSLQIRGIGASYRGEFSDNTFKGDYSQNGQTYDLVLREGIFDDHHVDVAEELIERLVGQWHAKTANTTFLFRFEPQSDGRVFAFVDFPSRQAAGFPITQFEQKGDAITFVVRGIAAEFEGTIDGSVLKGDWTVPDLQFPLEIVKAEN